MRIWNLGFGLCVRRHLGKSPGFLLVGFVGLQWGLCFW